MTEQNNPNGAPEQPIAPSQPNEPAQQAAQPAAPAPGHEPAQQAGQPAAPAPGHEPAQQAAQPAAPQPQHQGFGQVPPAQPQQPYAAAQQHEPYAQPLYTQPACPPPALTKLTGGMKFAWFVIGALVGIPGILLAWVCNADKYPQVKTDAVKFSAIGFAVWIVLGILFTMMVGGMLAAAVAGYDTGYHGYYGSTW